MIINISKLNLEMAKACMSTNDLADKAQVSRTSIGKLINGKTEPRPATVGKIAKALGCKVEDLIDGVAAPKEVK